MLIRKKKIIFKKIVFLKKIINYKINLVDGEILKKSL